MSEPPPTDTHAAPGSSLKRSFAKVLLIWALLAGVFAVFNILYWPAYRRQALTHPESFVAYARTLPDDAAAEVLRQGIIRFNPPYEEPYLLLADLESRASGGDAAGHYTSRARFYQALAKKSLTAEDYFALAGTVSQPYRQLGGEVLSSVRVAVASLSRALGLPDVVTAWPVPEQLGLLALGGSVFSTDGYIGQSGVRAPLPLLAYSGGGIDERRDAHILVGGDDHASRQRGMHIVLLNAGTGAVIRADLFDLWNSTFEAERMLHFLDNAPDGCIGLFAVCDEGAAFMTGTVENGLLQFGLERRAFVGREPRVLGLRFSFAAIGVKGASPGAALQVWSPDRFQGYRGHPVACGVFQGGGAP